MSELDSKNKTEPSVLINPDNINTAKHTHHGKSKSKGLNFFLLGMVVVAAAATTGLGIYYFAALRQRQNVNSDLAINAQESSQVSLNQNLNTNSESTFDFYNGALKFNYKLPKQKAYAKNNYQILGVDCQEVDATCKDAREIESMPAEWVVEDTTIPIYDSFLGQNVEFYGVRFNLLNGRYDNAEIGCDGICNSLGVVVVRSFVSNLDLEQAWLSLANSHNIANADGITDDNKELESSILERSQKWGLNTLKVSLPSLFPSAEFEENYLTKTNERIVLVSVYYQNKNNIEQLSNLINSFKF